MNITIPPPIRLKINIEKRKRREKPGTRETPYHPPQTSSI